MKAISCVFVVLWISMISSYGENSKGSNSGSPGNPLNYNDHIKPLLRKHCLKCHGDDKQKAGLNMQNYASLMKGGSGGEIVVAGRSSKSKLIHSVTDPDEDNRMPPKKAALPESEIALMQRWIDEGVREFGNSKSLAGKRDISFKPAAVTGKPQEIAMPSGLEKVAVPQVVRPLPVLAMDSSPWAPLLAVSGQNHVKLIHTETEKELGRLAFPEGIPYVIRFSRDGAVLMVAGGTPVEKGNVVLFDVKSGKRLAEIGDEIDSVISASLSPDQKLLALGGTGKTVKVYSTVDGSFKYKVTKHTDWITGLAFSPDGKILASADRSGMVYLLEAGSGAIVLNLEEHKASVNALDWRSDSKVLASSGDDGRIIWWNVKDGFPVISKMNAHEPPRPQGTYEKIPNGVLAIRFDHQGNLISSGRDHTVKVWAPDGREIKKFQLKEAIPVSTSFSNDGQKFISGDSSGLVTFFK